MGLDRGARRSSRWKGLIVGDRASIDGVRFRIQGSEVPWSVEVGGEMEAGVAGSREGSSEIDRRDGYDRRGESAAEEG